MSIIPPRPDSRPDGVNVWARWQAFRRDIFSSQPDRLYRAKMARMRGPFYNSFTVIDPGLARTVLTQHETFPKNQILGRTLFGMLGSSVFVTNGAAWARARKMIDPAFEGGRVKAMVPDMIAAGDAMLARLASKQGGVQDAEQLTAHVTADVILRTLFSTPIEDKQAHAIFAAFQAYQRAQPLASVLDVLRVPNWIPRIGGRNATQAAKRLRRVISDLITARQSQAQNPDDLLSRLSAARDVDGQGFGAEELADQVAIFLLAGHETSASALSWALYCLAIDSDTQDRAVAEISQACAQGIRFEMLRDMPFMRDIWREVLRLYPPVPMLPREVAEATTLRGSRAKPGDMVIVSPWHTHRQRDIWDDADAFDPTRWSRGVPHQAYFPYSAGARICPGAGFATTEGVLLLAMILQKFRVEPVKGHVPHPVAHLTVRARDGILLRFSPRL